MAILALTGYMVDVVLYFPKRNLRRFCQHLDGASPPQLASPPHHLLQARDARPLQADRGGAPLRGAGGAGQALQPPGEPPHTIKGSESGSNLIRPDHHLLLDQAFNLSSIAIIETY